VTAGDCDTGDKCSAGGQCSSAGSYAVTDVVCRDSAGPCDAPEYCTGDSHVCPQSDLKYGPDVQVFNESGNLVEGDMVCRGTCESCPYDVEEVCPGREDACPSDVIFQEELDVMAGQHHDAGYTTITATDLSLDGDFGTKVEVCVTIKLENGFELQKDDSGVVKNDSIKMELNDVGGLENKSPGGFNYKGLAAGYEEPNGVTVCHYFHIQSDESSTIYFTAHLDVVGPSGSETAWPKLPTSTDGTASTTTGSLLPHVFVKKSPKKGPNVQVVAATEDGGGDGIGWGNWFTFSIGCATANDTCSKSTSTGGGATTTTGTTVAPSTTTTAGHACTCSDDGTGDFLCQHASGSVQCRLFN
jgi:hypothetical protein